MADCDGACLGSPATLARGMDVVMASREMDLGLANATSWPVRLVGVPGVGFSVDEEEKNDDGKEDRRCEGVLKEGKAF